MIVYPQVSGRSGNTLTSQPKIPHKENLHIHITSEQNNVQAATGSARLGHNMQFSFP